MAEEKHEVLLRLRAIELLAYWEGRLITNRLMTWFGISRQQASSDIKRYLTVHNPDSLVHDPAVKGYVPRAGFRPVITDGQINDYLALMAGMAGETIAVTLEAGNHLAAVQLPDRTVRPEVVRELLRACRAHSSVKILYASMANPVWTERVISPHTLVYSGFRWHVRAFCHSRKQFRDFLLSRIDRSPKPCDDSAPNMAEDIHWAEHITLTLVPNPNLNSGQKALVEKEFGMPDGRMQITVRKALAHYTLQRFQVAVSSEETSDALKFPLILLASDRAKVQPFLFNAES